MPRQSVPEQSRPLPWRPPAKLLDLAYRVSPSAASCQGLGPAAHPRPCASEAVAWAAEVRYHSRRRPVLRWQEQEQQEQVQQELVQQQEQQEQQELAQQQVLVQQQEQQV